MYLYDDEREEEELEKLKFFPSSMVKTEKMELGNDDDDEEEVVYNNKSGGGRVWNESNKLWEIAAPAIVTAVAQFSFEFVTAAFIGHVGDLELAAVSVVQNVIEGFVYGIMVTIFIFLFLFLFLFVLFYIFF